MKPKFCPNCHRQIVLPKWLTQQNKANIQGTIVINCGNCPSGKIKIKGNKIEEN